AIIARELKKPCIIGTKIATQVLKDGDLVEVDACPSGSSEPACQNGEAGCANRGVVTILK
ncbi:MAG: PEP-utilizing enzyme, partial [Patescibacteria group bacterium]